MCFISVNCIFISYHINIISNNHYIISYHIRIISKVKCQNPKYGYKVGGQKTLRNFGYTGCPLLLWTLCFLPFIVFQSAYNKNFGHFCKAHKILNWKMSLILKIDQYLTEIWPPQCWIPYFKINIFTEVFVTVTELRMMTRKEFALISQDKKQPLN